MGRKNQGLTAHISGIYWLNKKLSWLQLRRRDRLRTGKFFEESEVQGWKGLFKERILKWKKYQKTTAVCKCQLSNVISLKLHDLIITQEPDAIIDDVTDYKWEIMYCTYEE